MKVTPIGLPWYYAFDMSFAANSLSLSNGSGEYDCNADGQPEPATWNLAMTR